MKKSVKFASIALATFAVGLASVTAIMSNNKRAEETKAYYKWHEFATIPQSLRSGLTSVGPTSYSNARLNLYYFCGDNIVGSAKISPSYTTPTDSYFDTVYYYFSDNDIKLDFINSPLANSYELYGEVGYSLLDFCNLYGSDYNKIQSFDCYVDPDRRNDHYTVLDKKDQAGKTFYFVAGCVLNEKAKAVTITKGTGVSSVYLSTSSTAQSGDASGKTYSIGTKVYGFATLSAGYEPKSGWTKVTGSTYCVGSVTVSSSGTNSFGTISPTATSYSISYNLNGGTATNPSSYTVATNTFTLNNPTKTGYTFTGWTGSNGNTPQTTVTISKGSTGAKSYNANWTVNTFTVKYNKNASDATGSMSNVTATYNQGYTIADVGFSRTGYDFLGWATSASGSKVYNNKQALTASNINSMYATAGKGGTYNLYAKWQLKSEIQNVINKINAIGTVSYPGSKGKINDARSAYDALSSTYQGLVSNYQTLVNAENSYEILKNNAINNTINAINAIGEVTYPGSKNAILTARSYYDALGDTEKNIQTIPNYNTLVEAETLYNHVDNAVNKINAIGNVTLSEQSKAKIDEARAAYEALNEDEQALVPAASLQTLEAAEAKYAHAKAVYDEIADLGSVQINDQYKEKLDDARDSYEALTGEEQVIVSNYGDLTHKEGVYEHSLAVIEEIDALGEPEVSEEFKNKLDSARGNYNALTGEEKALISNYTDLTHKEKVYADAKAVVDEIAALGAVSVTEEFKNKLDSARGHYDALTEEEQGIVYNYNVLTQKEGVYADSKAVIDEINALGPTEATLEYGEKLDSARDNYDALTEEEQNIITNYLDLTHKEEVYGHARAVVEEIDALGPVEVSDEFKIKMENARESYNGLTGEEQVIVYNIGVLDHDEVTYEHAKEVVDIIDALPKVEYNVVFKSILDETRGAFDALAEEEQGIVYNYDKLLHAEDVYYSAEGVILLIQNVGELEVSEECEAKLEAARETYEALTDEEKNYVINIQDLDRMEEIYANAKPVYEAIEALDQAEVSDGFKNKIDACKEMYAELSNEEKELITNYGKIAEAEEKYAHAKPVVDEIAALGTPSVTDEFKEKLDNAREHYEALSDAEKAMVYNVNDLEHLEDVYNHAKAVMDLIDAIGEVDLSQDCKDKVQNVRSAYEALSEEEKALVSNYGKLTHAEDVIAHTEGAIATINNIGEIAVNEECKGKIDVARHAYDALTSEEKALVNNYETLTHAEKVYGDAKNVIDLINAIGKIEVTDTCKGKIDAARHAYDALTSEEKALVTNYNDLVHAEATYANAKEVVDKITAIGQVKYTEESKAKMDAAQQAYDSLSTEEKAIVSNYQTLVNDKQEYAHVGEVIELINKIGDVELNEESKEKIDEAKKAYDALSDAEKSIVPTTSAGKLDNSVKQYQDLVQKRDISITLIIVGSVVGLAVLILIIFLLAKKRKKREQE